MSRHNGYLFQHFCLDDCSFERTHNMRLNRFPSNGVATDLMTVFFYIFNAFN